MFLLDFLSLYNIMPYQSILCMIGEIGLSVRQLLVAQIATGYFLSFSSRFPEVSQLQPPILGLFNVRYVGW
jgi:hypothetical protein